MDTGKLEQLFFGNNYSLDNLLIQVNENENKINLLQLHLSLIRYQQDLDRDQLKLLDNFYDKFYKLSCILNYLNERVQQLYKPSKTFRDKLSAICEKQDSYIRKINNKLSSIKETCENKELASKLCRLIKTRDRLSRQIKNFDQSIGSKGQTWTDQDIAYNVEHDFIERLKTELFLLSCQITAIKPTFDELIAIKQSLQNSVRELQAKFISIH